MVALAKHLASFRGVGARVAGNVRSRNTCDANRVGLRAPPVQIDRAADMTQLAGARACLNILNT